MVLVGALIAFACLIMAVTLLPAPVSATGAGADKSATRATSPAKKKAQAKCKKVKKASARKACLSQVNQRFLPPVVVDVRDDYFAPSDFSVRSGRRVTWDWGTSNGNSHNFMLDPLLPQPKGLTRADYFRLDSGQNYAINKKITRDLVKTGEYNFYCSLHSTVMRMKVKVTK